MVILWAPLQKLWEWNVTVLANLNKITNMDLIFPDTVLTTTVNNEEEEVTEVEIQTPQADASEEWQLRQLIWRKIKWQSMKNSSSRRPSQPIEDAPTVTETEKQQKRSKFRSSETTTVAEETPSTETPVAEETETAQRKAPVAETTSPVEEAQWRLQLPKKRLQQLSRSTSSSCSSNWNTCWYNRNKCSRRNSSINSNFWHCNFDYQAEQSSQAPSRTYSAPAAPDYAGLAAKGSRMLVFNHKLQPSRRNCQFVWNYIL